LIFTGFGFSCAMAPTPQTSNNTAREAIVREII
jgi:hypothetical protein